MTARNEGSQRFREWKTTLLTRIAQRAMTKRTTGVDGFAKSLLAKGANGSVPPDPELEHPDDWDRPVD